MPREFQGGRPRDLSLGEFTDKFVGNFFRPAARREEIRVNETLTAGATAARRHLRAAQTMREGATTTQ
jgi:hypothetical protein